MYSLPEVQNYTIQLKKNKTDSIYDVKKNIKININFYSVKKNNLTGLIKFSNPLHHKNAEWVYTTTIIPLRRKSANVLRRYHRNMLFKSVLSNKSVGISSSIMNTKKANYQKNSRITKMYSYKKARINFRNNWHVRINTPLTQRYYKHYVERKSQFYAKARLAKSYRGRDWQVWYYPAVKSSVLSFQVQQSIIFNKKTIKLDDKFIHSNSVNFSHHILRRIPHSFDTDTLDNITVHNDKNDYNSYPRTKVGELKINLRYPDVLIMGEQLRNIVLDIASTHAIYTVMHGVSLNRNAVYNIESWYSYFTEDPYGITAIGSRLIIDRLIKKLPYLFSEGFLCDQNN